MTGSPSAISKLALDKDLSDPAVSHSVGSNAEQVRLIAVCARCKDTSIGKSGGERRKQYDRIVEIIKDTCVGSHWR